MLLWFGFGFGLVEFKIKGRLVLFCWIIGCFSDGCSFGLILVLVWFWFWFGLVEFEIKGRMVWFCWFESEGSYR